MTDPCKNHTVTFLMFLNENENNNEKKYHSLLDENHIAVTISFKIIAELK